MLEVQAIGEDGTCTYEQVDRKWLLLNKWVEEEASKKIVDDAIASEFESARLKALQARSAGAFLDGVPSCAGGTLLNGNEFRRTYQVFFDETPFPFVIVYANFDFFLDGSKRFA